MARKSSPKVEVPPTVVAEPETVSSEVVTTPAAVEEPEVVTEDPADVVPDTIVPENTRPVSRVSQILDIKDEKQLLAEMKKFEDSVYERIRPLRVLLVKDIHSSEVASIQNHMSDVERWRETVLRWSSLMKTFVSHCKSDHFIVKREPGMRITEFDREAYQKRLLAGFVGLDTWLEGVVDSIDSRVNMAKVLLRLDESGQYHPGAQKVA